MSDEILQLHPQVGRRRLAGLYLAEDICRLERPLVYTNFITSLDGRISEVDAETGLRRVPSAIANARDWRLHLELAAQADGLLTTDRHLRAVARGRHADLLRLDQYPDLAQWRQARQLVPQPPVAAVSIDLDFPETQLRANTNAQLLILTRRGAPPKRLRALDAQGIEVIELDEGPRLNGGDIVKALRLRGWTRLFSLAGPSVLHALLAAGVLDRLYLTLAQRILGGQGFDTLTRGPALAPPPGFRLRTLYSDSTALDGAGQLFFSFERIPKEFSPSGQAAED